MSSASTSKLALRGSSVIALSCALHLLALAVFSAARSTRTQRTRQDAISLELAAYTPADHAASPLAASDSAPNAVAPALPAARRPISVSRLAPAPTATAQRSDPSTSQAPPSETPAVAPPATPALEPAPAAPSVASAPPARVQPDLSPRGVALAAQPLPAPLADALPGDRAALRSAQLSAELNAAANARPFARRASPQLKRDPDGTCHYDGEAIAATILPDGGVQFEDKPTGVAVASIDPLAPGQLLPRGGVPEPPARPVTPEELVPEQRAELRMKSTPRAWQAERDWFLRETVSLRRELADATHARELVVAKRELRKQLERIWCDGSREAAQRRRALFELWDDTSTDAVGQAGRDVIVEYIQLNLPAGDPDAYPPQQLAALNAGRTQRAAFDPYAAAQDRR